MSAPVESMTAPALTLRDDDLLVVACKAQGGFPRAVIVGEATIWASWDNKPWRFLGPKMRRARPVAA